MELTLGAHHWHQGGGGGDGRGALPMARPLLLLPLLLAGAASDEALPTVHPQAGPAALPSRGCGNPVGSSLPVGSPLDMNIKVDDPLLFNKFREYYL